MKLKTALVACVLGTAIAGCSDHQVTQREITAVTAAVTTPEVKPVADDAPAPQAKIIGCRAFTGHQRIVRHRSRHSILT